MVSNLPLRSNGMPIGTAIIAFTTSVTLDWQLRSALDSLVAATSLWSRSANIATELSFSVATVKAEVATLLRLYSATDRNDLIAKSERSWC